MQSIKKEKIKEEKQKWVVTQQLILILEIKSEFFIVTTTFFLNRYYPLHYSYFTLDKQKKGNSHKSLYVSFYTLNLGLLFSSSG